MRKIILLQPVLLFLVPVLLLSQKGNSPEDIMEKLFRANDNKIILKPKVAITHDRKNAAYFLRDEILIEVSEKTLEVCRSFGADSAAALSFILGHEYSHASQLELKAKRTSFLAYDKAENSSKKEEEAADISGAFMSYLAGYKSLDLIEPLIDRIYQAFNLKDDLKGYPSLEERKQTAKRVKELVGELIGIYEAANWLTAVGRFELAIPNYEYVSKWYKGREVYNNLGISYLSLALNFANINLDEFVYPFEINWNIRLKKPILARGENMSKADALLRQEYLNKSQEYFALASKLDPMYISSEINVMCVLMLQGKSEDALNYYEKNSLNRLNYKVYQDDENKDKLRIALALCYAKVNQVDQAIRILEDVLKNSNKSISGLAKLNLGVLRGKAISTTERRSCVKFSTAQKQIDGVKIHKLPESEHWILLNEKDDLYLSIHEYKKSTLYTFKNGKYFLNLQIVNEVLPKIKIMDPAAIILTSTGALYHCEDEKYILRLDKNNAVVAWAKYE